MSRSSPLDTRIIRIFISSTFRDMQDERDELMKKTFPVLRRKAAERDVTLTELDLRWGITPEESESGKVVEICLREIENSAPFFIGIIGNRYGWIPSQGDLGESLIERFSQVNGYVERQLSVTEMEMQFGVLERPDDMHAFFFIKKQETDDADEPEKLAALKAAVRNNGRYPVASYSSPEDLAGQVEAAFTKLLDELYPEGALSELDKERIGQRAYLNSLCQNYIRTDANFAVIDEWMQDWKKHQLVIIGASGLGKSALVANWVNEKFAVGDALPYRIIYHFVGNGGSLGSHGHVIKALCDEIRDKYGFAGDSNESQNDEKALENLVNKVAAEGDKPLVIVLDAINQIIDIDHSKRLNWLPIPPKNVKILFTTLKEDETMSVFKDRHYPIFTLKPLTKVQRKEMVRQYLSSFSKKLQPYQIERIVSDAQCKNTLVLKTLLDELVNFGIFEQLDEKIGSYLGSNSVEDFYAILLKGYEADFGEPFVKHILSLIAVSRNGLSEEEILAITGEAPLHWSQFFCAIRQHLIVKNGLISFAHGYIRKAIEKRYVDGQDDWVRSCREEIVGIMKDRRAPRILNELAYQYNELDDVDALYLLLLNFEVFNHFYLTSKVELGHYWRKIIASDNSRTPLDYRECSSNEKEKHLNDVAVWSRCVLANLNWSQTLAECALSIAQEKGNKQAMADAYSYIGVVYEDSGAFQQALELHEKDLAIEIELHGPVFKDVANALDNLGRAWHGLGNYEKAGGYYNKALAIYEQLNDREHVAIEENNLGIISHARGDEKQAIKYLKNALKINLYLFGDNHREVGTCFNNLSNVYTSIGQYSAAIDYSRKALMISLHNFGVNHYDSASAYNNLACAYQESGELEKALDFYKISLKIDTALFGEENHHTATALSNLAILSDLMGKHDLGLNYALKALSIRLKVLGEDNPDTAESYNSVGAFYADAQQYSKALEMYNKARGILFKLKGENKETLASVYDNIGSNYLDLSDAEKAINYYKKGLSIRRRLFGDNNKHTIQSINNLALAYESVDIKVSIKHYKQALSLQISTYGESSIQARKICDNLRYCYYELGDYNYSLTYALQAYDINKQLSNNNPDLIYYASQVGECYYSLGKYLEAASFFEEELNNYQHDSLDSFDCLCSLANSLRKGEAYKEAEIRYKELTHLAEQSNDPQRRAKAFKLYGYYYLDLGEYSKSIDMLDRSYNSFHDNEEAAEARRLASVLLRRQGQFKLAINYCDEAAALFKKQKNNSGVAHCYLSKGLTFKEQGNLEQAKKWFNKALVLRKRLLSPDDPLIKECVDYIKSL